ELPVNFYALNLTADNINIGY
nr:RecName: Full=35 kDa cell wall protein [Phaseolus vulgaris]